jgi:hypothetical protein
MEYHGKMQINHYHYGQIFTPFDTGSHYERGGKSKMVRGKIHGTRSRVLCSEKVKQNIAHS